jgi:hypothetical protein
MNNIDKIRQQAIAEIKNKANKNPGYLHPLNKERLEDMKRLQFESGYLFTNWMQQNGIMKKPLFIGHKALDIKLKNADCKTLKEYKDKCAKAKGLENSAEDLRLWRYKAGINLPAEFNPDCASYLGKWIGERTFEIFLRENVFDFVERIGGDLDKGIDFKCKNPKQVFNENYPGLNLKLDIEYIFQLKLRCISKTKGKSDRWVFNGLKSLVVPDYFILCGLDNRDKLNPLFILVINRDEIIRGVKLYEKRVLSITNTFEFKKYSLNKELESLIMLMDRTINE